MIVEHLTVGALGCTCTIIADKVGGDAIVIDAGAEAKRIFARTTSLGLQVRHLLHTHAHIDHVGATTELRACCGARAAIHQGDLQLVRALDQQAAFLRLPRIPEPVFDDYLVDGDEIRIGTATITALHTPGHTHGSMSFALADDERYTIMTGDTLFAGGVGRWDIGGTSLADIVHSISTKLLPYPDDAIVIPGHGAHTTIGNERRMNPYLKAG